MFIWRQTGAVRCAFVARVAITFLRRVKDEEFSTILLSDIANETYVLWIEDVVTAIEDFRAQGRGLEQTRED